MSRLVKAAGLLNEVVTAAKKIAPPEVHTAHQAALEQITKAMRTASHANDNAYMERVPPFETLAEVTPKSIVKAMPISDLHLPPSSSPPPEPSGGTDGGGGSGGGGDGAMSHGQTLWYFTSFTLLLAHEKSVEEGLG